MLELRATSKSFAGNKILDAVNLNLPAYGLACLTGPSGVGKSTLLEIAAGIIKPDSGEVFRAKDPSLVFQDDALLPWLSALENILYIRPEGVTKEIFHQTAATWLHNFGLEPDKLPLEMSGGMRRRLNLARAFASGRKLMLFDEPFAFLDESWQKNITGYILAAAAEGAAVLLSSHTAAPLRAGLSFFPELAEKIRYTRYALNGGKLQIAPPAAEDI